MFISYDEVIIENGRSLIDPQNICKRSVAQETFEVLGHKRWSFQTEKLQKSERLQTSYKKDRRKF